MGDRDAQQESSRHIGVESDSGGAPPIQSKGGPMTDSTTPIINPYAPPVATVEEAEVGGDAERIRREHLNVETNLKTLGFLQLLGGFLAIPASMLLLLMTAAGEQLDAEGLGFAVGVLGIGTLSLVSGFLLRKLSPRARVPATIVAALGLLQVPVGTVINGWLLVLMYGAKGRRVLSDEYQEIVLATPHVKHRTSPAVWVVVAMMVGGLLLGLAYGFLRG